MTLLNFELFVQVLQIPTVSAPQIPFPSLPHPAPRFARWPIFPIFFLMNPSPAMCSAWPSHWSKCLFHDKRFALVVRADVQKFVQSRAKVLLLYLPGTPFTSSQMPCRRLHLFLGLYCWMRTRNLNPTILFRLLGKREKEPTPANSFSVLPIDDAPECCLCVQLYAKFYIVIFFFCVTLHAISYVNHSHPFHTFFRGKLFCLVIHYVKYQIKCRDHAV